MEEIIMNICSMCQIKACGENETKMRKIIKLQKQLLWLKKKITAK